MPCPGAACGAVVTDPADQRAPASRTPRVAVVGGGIVGLNCAWYLQQEGAEVTVLERRRLGAGASWGNAGALAPAIAVPLPERSALTSALRGAFDRNSAIVTPRRLNGDLVRFLLGFARNATERRWYQAMHDYLPLSNNALAAYEFMAAHDVQLSLNDARFVIACHDAGEAAGLLRELSMVIEAGLPLQVDMLTTEQLHEAAPAAAGCQFGLRIHGQRFVDPPQLLDAVADSVRVRGGEIVENLPISKVERRLGKVVCTTEDGADHGFDAVVLATGAWLPRLARDHGVRVPMQAGRGYSASVPPRDLVPGMLYFPGPRIACTPYRGRLRISSVMELAGVDRPLTPRLADAFLRRARAALPNADWAKVEDVWVGSRPLTADGRPFIGGTATKGVFVAGGHAMWGVTFGAVTAQLLAKLVVGSSADAALAPFDPLRRHTSMA